MFPNLSTDTVCMPALMSERMSGATVVEDGAELCPPKHSLEKMVAGFFGKSAGLHTPTAGMANVLAILVQVQRGDTIVAGSSSGIFTSVRAAPALSGTVFKGCIDSNGSLELAALSALLRPSPANILPRLVCVESRHHTRSGAVESLEHMQTIRALARAAGANVHLDAIHAFKAEVVFGLGAKEMGRHADTIAVCLPGASMGAVLIGSKEAIRRARKISRLLDAVQLPAPGAAPHN